MSKDAMIRARIEPELKEEVEDIFRELGLTITEAITLFYQQVRLNRGLPFVVRLPKKTTVDTLEDTDAGRNLAGVRDSEELVSKMELQQPVGDSSV